MRQKIKVTFFSNNSQTHIQFGLLERKNYHNDGSFLICKEEESSLAKLDLLEFIVLERKKKKKHLLDLLGGWKINEQISDFFLLLRNKKIKKIIEYIYIYIYQRKNLLYLIQKKRKKNLLYISTFLYNINSTVSSFLSLFPNLYLH